MKNKVIDIIDFEKIDVLLESFNKFTGFVTAILDVEGNVLSQSGWRQICTDFHRINEETAKRCTLSDTLLAGKMIKGEKYHSYVCLNGLVDVAVPIIVNEEHIANLFTGQFFFEKPDVAFFIEQAKTYGFEEKIYLEALNKVPVVSEEKVKEAINFLLNMTNLISNMAYQKLEQIELNEKLKESEDRWQFAIEGNGDGLWDWDVQKEKIFFSENWKSIFGYTSTDIGDGIDEWEKRIHPDDQKQAKLDMQNHLNGKSNIYSNEHRILCKDGTYKWVLAKGKIFARSSNTTSIRLIGTHSDITERKLAENKIIQLNEVLEKNVIDRTAKLANKSKQLKDSQHALLNIVEDLNEKNLLIEKSAAQLENANNELQAFSYSVSHDLKAPLRGIDGYSKLLMDLYAAELNEEAQTFLQNIRVGTNQMNQLIEDLLAYSRLERSAFDKVKVDPEKVMNSILNTYQDEIRDRKIIINIDNKCDELYADFDGLSMAIRNVFENALKFTKTTEQPIINIKMDQDQYNWTITVNDNGIGFNMVYHDKIFEIFQRLQRIEDYPGTGIGLALVYKAMQRMGGRVWAESTIGKGTTFFLEINKLQLQ